MTSLFKKPPKPQLPKAPPPPPTIDDAAASEEMSRKLARRRGRAALVRSKRGDAAPSVAVKELLG